MHFHGIAKGSGRYCYITKWHIQDSAEVGQQFPHRFTWKIYRLRENMLEGSHACLQVEYGVFYSQKKIFLELTLTGTVECDPQGVGTVFLY